MKRTATKTKTLTKRERQAARALAAWTFCGFVSVGVMIWSIITDSDIVFWPSLVIAMVSVVVLGTGFFIPDE